MVISPRAYNERVGLCIACPITDQAKGYPFEVAIPVGHGVTGVVLSDQLRSVSWPERNAKIIGTAPAQVLEEARAKIAALIGIGWRS
jgi:mRNA interferase MazF